MIMPSTSEYENHFAAPFSATGCFTIFYFLGRVSKGNYSGGKNQGINLIDFVKLNTIHCLILESKKYS
jgi:hypothetical protein